MRKHFLLYINNSTTNKMSKIFLTAVWKSRHRHLGISIGIDVDIGIAKNLFCPAKSLFLPFEVLYEENIHGEVRCLEQLFCRKPVSACFLRKELHGTRYLRSFKNTQELELHFAS